MSRLIHASLLTLSALTLSAAQADEGVYEISPLCVATGCFDGDAPGWPVTLSNPGRYVLTGNLDVRNEADPVNTDAIVIGSIAGRVDITLDLNGFEIRGPVTCTGTPVTSCSAGAGQGDGITVTNNVRLTVRQGAIVGMGNIGVRCASVSASCRIEDVRVEQNRQDGITGSAGLGVTIRNVSAQNNGGSGIVMVRGSIRDSLVRGNAANGLSAGLGSVDSVDALNNGQDGIVSSGPVSNSNAENNNQDGINCFSCIATGNRASSNGRFGLRLNNGSVYGSNLLSFNDSSDLNTLGPAFDVESAPNLCNDGSC
ncbi:right-handed parallel beta-helix repeat-containing protein [Wenzhouxiangella marina]|uniref:Right handed beta helix domain-containing protein n=1 Tax=Wenzhouxiangella marina TaxID=1579979 RepID=A0A0K0XTN5_9GAMM|nr:right-handed parallel beta-helix repeat-containing protein [Wenzhouxiangella marina]AKS41074.1 hypothetical protein WM2015_693 [Wenzhouxiangella marina]MBB6087952.1 hypothetical protein [Wenzhouxiangella marina]